MGNMTGAFVFVMSINVLMFLATTAIADINPNAPKYFSNNGTIIEDLAKNQDLSNPVLDTDKAIDELPTGAKQLNPDTNNIFTDIFNTVKSWFSTGFGLKYLYNIIVAPYTMLKMLHLDPAFTFALGALWYGITFFITVAFIFGGRE